MRELTDRQRQLLLFIENHLQIKGYPPSIREMADHMGIRSTNGVNDHLKALERKGYISRMSNLKSRAISLVASAASNGSSDTEPQEPIVAVPIVGRVAAGVPVLAEENVEDTLHVGQSLIQTNKKVFALKVRGDSMIEKGILDGDIVFVKHQQTADNGEIVVAMLDGEATVKTFRQLKNSIRLEPANSSMKPIIVREKDFSNTDILGVVTGVYRNIQ
jgi:repressor LexA